MPASKVLPDEQTRDAYQHADEVFTVASEAIDRFAYDALTETLFVTFVKGTTWFYLNVPADVWESFKSADSKGKFFQANIRDRYSYGEL